MTKQDNTYNKVEFIPWVGESYYNPIYFSKKTLIIGESNYTKNPYPQLVIKCVEDHISENEDPNFSKFATKIRRVIFGRDTTISRKDFWNDVSFYNFVQILVGEKSRERPKPSMWKDSVPAFEEIIENISPDRILILGLENWKNISKYIPYKSIGNFEFSLTEYNIYTIVTAHPSSAFSYKKWSPIAEKLLR